jgi:hypothetical protein
MTPANFARLQALVTGRPTPSQAFAIAEALRAVVVARHPGTHVDGLAAHAVSEADPVGAAACRLAALTIAARYMIAIPEIVEGEIVWSQPIAASEAARRQLRDLHAVALVISGALEDQASALVIGPSALDGANRDGDDAEIATVIAPMVTRAQIEAERDADLDALAALFPVQVCGSDALLARVAAVQSVEASIAEWEAFAARLPS